MVVFTSAAGRGDGFAVARWMPGRSTFDFLRIGPLSTMAAALRGQTIIALAGQGDFRHGLQLEWLDAAGQTVRGDFVALAAAAINQDGSRNSRETPVRPGSILTVLEPASRARRAWCC